MRKRIMNQDAGSVSSPNQQWLDVEHLAQVEVSSEDPGHPVESASIGDSRQLGTASSMQFEWILSLSGNLVSDRQI